MRVGLRCISTNNRGTEDEVSTYLMARLENVVRSYSQSQVDDTKVIEIEKGNNTKVEETEIYEKEERNEEKNIKVLSRKK